MAKKFGLGKGLDALLPDTAPVEQLQETKKTNNNEKIDINTIKPNKEQPRKYFDDEKIQELSESIKELGMIQPIVVKRARNGKDYIIVAGERRWRAAKIAGMKEVPVVKVELSDKEVMEVSLIENIQRQDLNPVEEALAYRKLIDDFSMTQEEVSKRLGKSRVAISNTMRLLNLDDKVLDFIAQGIISEGHGRVLLQIENPTQQYKVCQKIIDDKMSVRETETYVRNYEKMSNLRGKQPPKNVFLKDLETKMTGILGTKVIFKPKSGNRGKIEIEYYSNEDLDRILEHLNVHE